jgi:HEPN domain-containing protein
MRPITAEWVSKAEEDYTAALYLSRKRKSSIPDIVCFHCQQCAEKYLKALLMEAEVRFPKTHDLLALLKLVAPVVPFLLSFHERLERMNDYAVEFRYPSESATKEEARIALANCRALRKEIRKILGLDEPPSAQMNLRIKEKPARYKVQRKRRVKAGRD